MSAGEDNLINVNFHYWKVKEIYFI